MICTPFRSISLLSALGLLLFLVGCDDAPSAQPTPEEEPSAQADEQTPEATSDGEIKADPREDSRFETAQAADRKLRHTLMGRVQEVMGEDGPVAAVDVCHQEAIPLTEEIAEEFDVAIGRVSDQLRNPDNQGHEWVWSMIDDANGQPHYDAEDAFRAVTPIELAEGCATCHGQQDDIADDVADAIAANYPDDQATGYDVGDIRGWVWVQVP